METGWDIRGKQRMTSGVRDDCKDEEEKVALLLQTSKHTRQKI